MTARIFTTIILIVAFTAISRAERLSGSTGKAVLNAFIAFYAKEEVTWKKDIRLNELPGKLQAGRQLGQSAVTGYYSFVPKTWDDLTERERVDVIRDHRLKAFLLSTRRASVASVAANGAVLFPIEGVSDAPGGRSKSPAIPTSRSVETSPAPVVIKVSPQTAAAGDRVKVDLK